MREMLIFGQAYAGASPWTLRRPLQPYRLTQKSAAATAFARARSIDAIAAKGLTTIDDVRAHTKASASCGSCTGLVEKLLVVSLGDAYKPNAIQPMCGCTDLGHGDVRRLIVAQEIEVHSGTDAGAGVENLLRLRQMPPGAQLLSARRHGPANMKTTTSRASSTSACTPISRRTALIPSCRACGAA